MGSGVDGSNSGECAIPYPEQPAHERAKTNDSVVYLGNEHERSPERTLEVFPPEEIGRSMADWTGAEGST
jgi:hypothetical protein